jgi:hypothetical protein
MRDPHESMSSIWRILERIPKADKYKDWKARKSFLGHYIPDGEPRTIPIDACVHESVEERIRLAPKYRPINLSSRYQVIPMLPKPNEVSARL